MTKIIIILSSILLSSSNVFHEKDSCEQILISSNTNGVSSLEIDVTPLKCFKICKKGKACGDTCIKKTYTCTKPPGCACNG